MTSKWSSDQGLADDIAFALPRTHIRGIRRAFTEEERFAIGKKIVEHLRLCGWQFHLPEAPIGHGTGTERTR